MVIDNISKANVIVCTDFFEIKKGDCIAVIGKNGQGKTTLLRTLSGNIFPDSGKIKLEGKCYNFPIRLRRRPKYQKEFRKQILYIENQGYLYNNLTCDQNISYYMSSRNFDEDAFWDLLDKFEFDKNGLKKKIKETSLGTKQKILLSLAFSSMKSIILLDEPTLGLDICSRNILVEEIKKAKESKTVVISTNDQMIMNIFDLYLLCENDEVKRLHDNPYN